MIVLLILAVYLAAGVVFGLAFCFSGVQRLDRDAVGAPPQFRLLILPGATALWPVLAIKWATAPRPSTLEHAPDPTPAPEEDHA